jgi:adenylate cyclase
MVSKCQQFNRDFPKLTPRCRQSGVVCAGVVAFILALHLIGALDGLERIAFDFRMRLLRLDKAMPADVVLILIDEASLDAMEVYSGRWPWRRDVHADLIDFLKLGGARTIIFDILFTESSNSTLAGISVEDQRLVEATQTAGNVVHASQLVRDEIDEPKRGSTLQALSIGHRAEATISSPHRWQSIPYNTAYLPFESLKNAARSIGATTFTPDQDGVFRRAELVFNYNNTFIPALSLTPWLCNQAKARLDLEPRRLALSTPSGRSTIPLDRDNGYLVNLYGRYSAFSFSGVYLSFLLLQQGDVENLPVHPEEFKDKIVFIGASAAGVEDLKATGIGGQTPGVLLHASVYSNIATNDILRPVPYWINVGLLLLAVAIAAAGIFYGRSLVVQIAICAMVLAALIAMNLFLFSLNRVADFVPPVGAVVGTYLTAFTWISFLRNKEKRKIKTVLGQYVSPAILTCVLSNHKEAYVRAEVGQREQLTLLFSDVRGFTSIAEQYPVEHVVALLNRYLECMVDVIFNHQGTLDKFIGDAIMAFWGAPLKHADHAYRAVTCAIAMQKALIDINQESRQCNMPPMHTGIGIHTAEVILGNIGSRKKLDYTVIGDGVNLASRLEGLTKRYQCPIIISQNTYTTVRDLICCRVVDHVRVKGKNRTTVIYEPLGSKKTMDVKEFDLVRLTDEGFKHYCQRRFRKAAMYYEQILDYRPQDALSLLFIRRCKQYLRQPPPPEWQGEYTHELK